MLKTKNLQKKKLFVGGLLIMLMVSTILVIPTIADDEEDEEEEEIDPPEDDEEDTEDETEDEDDDGIDDEEEEENEREVQVEVSDNEVQIESEQTVGDVTNEFQVKVKTEDEGLTFKLEYSNDTDDAEFELEFKVKIQEIIEYVDTTEDGFYNDSVDTEVQVYELNDFLPIDYTFDNSTGTPIYTLDVSTTDGVFTGGIFFSSEFILVDGVVVAPTQIKIDIGIHNFPYIEDNSDLALKVKIESEAEYEEDDETEDEEDGRATDEKEIEISTGDATGFFSWIETAVIDGVEQVVKATPIELDEGEQKLYLNYPRGNEIIHDPKIGVTNVLQDINTPGVTPGVNGFLIFTAISTIAVIGLISLTRRRNKK